MIDNSRLNLVVVKNLLLKCVVLYINFPAIQFFGAHILLIIRCHHYIVCSSKKFFMYVLYVIF